MDARHKNTCSICLAYMVQHLKKIGYLTCSCGFMKKEYTNMTISKDELLMGRDKKYADEYTQEISDNLDKLLIPMNQIRAAYNKPMIVSSGWRPAAINAKTPGAAKTSKHMIGLAADIVDTDGNLRKWVLQNLQLMKDLDIYLENFNFTPGWVHFGLGPPNSGKRIFIPSPTEPLQVVWDGIYDKKFDQE